MRVVYEDRFSELEPLLEHVEKPSRYIDHEWGSLSQREARYRVCLIHPDIYEVGLSNQGISILYAVLNSQENISCERGYLPWIDMADAMRAAGVPLLSSEGSAPVSSFDLVGIHLPHEMAATNCLEVLDLAGIALRAADRGEDDPLVIAGGPAVFNPEPIAPFFDAVLIGEGEESIVEVARAHERLRDKGATRQQTLRALARIPGCYVSALYEISHRSPCTPHGFAVPRAEEQAPTTVVRRVLADFGATDPVAQSVVPYVETVCDRLSIEVLRGCARGCRFCQAGMAYRPVRERSADQIVSAVARGLSETGYGEVSLASLSTTDHSMCAHVLERLNRRYEGSGISVSIPSQRLDAFGADMALAAVGGENRGGLAFAPEAGSQRLRDIINKNVTERDLDEAITRVFKAGWRRVKLYFMMGLPGERDEDIVAIAGLAQRAADVARAAVRPAQRAAVQVFVFVSVFVPKASTPFQWCARLEDAEVRRRQRLLLDSVGDRAVRVSCHDADASLVEAALSRAGRDMADVIEGAWRRGARFDAWTEQFDLSRWRAAATELGSDLVEIACTPFALSDRLAWEHVSTGASRSFLEREYRRAKAEMTTPDCTRGSCSGCGVCGALGVANALAGERS
ncbi:Radical SAM domain protein [Coriobacterium glomerans PW2]|uniref:Radical SAM domain protein n=1 Tax=Coriobacterium glomerans (strain ATCC 49209 / DSM 20642 / JCM 10262 / PW2) TaxID=700015 RepID=F2N7T0_CORGP|nr:TIGR03960 family B12-binding radical SAM protein [Coriobacterium glomerans]AEB06972.1 Radical SAM domain protein [Coriobacterium glomerans PW2]